MNWLTAISGIVFLSKIHAQSAINPQGANVNCTCVEYYRCRTGTNPDEPLIDIRLGGKCKNVLHVCCEAQDLLPDPTDINPNARNVQCGKSNPGGVGFRLEGGQNNETQFGEFPWMIALLLEQQYGPDNTTVYVYQCGGSLIHPQVVLTTAHCMVNRTLSQLRVRAGEWDTQGDSELFPHQDQLIDRVVMHEDFYQPTLQNDVALIILQEPFELDEHVDMICIPDMNVRLDKQNCFATGWGKNSFGAEGRYSILLKKLQLPLYKRVQCLGALRRTRLGPRFQLHDTFICAGGEADIDTCKGDGGSPLFCEMSKAPGHYQLVGLVAWGIGCGQKNVPGVYVNVLLFKSWINQQMAFIGFNSSTYTYRL